VQPWPVEAHAERGGAVDAVGGDVTGSAYAFEHPSQHFTFGHGDKATDVLEKHAIRLF
jgi:hypothetical protein